MQDTGEGSRFRGPRLQGLAASTPALTNPGTESCTRSGRKWTWPRRVSASRPSTSGGRTVSTILAYNRSPSLMTRPPASTSGITGTLSSWNLKILQINQVRARPVVSSGVKRTASCQHRPHRTAPGSLLVAVVWDSLDLLLFFIVKYT